MARSIGTHEAKEIVNVHNFLLKEIERAIASTAVSEDNIRKAADALLTYQGELITGNIPVEELSRSRSGLRIKALKDYGYTTLGQIAEASVRELSFIRGISMDMAYTIKITAQEYIEKAKQSAKIKLSADDKSPGATALIEAVYKYIAIQKAAELANRLKLNSEYNVRLSIANMKPLTGGLRWLFSSSATKKKAEDSCKFLQELLDSEYGNDAKNVCNYLQKADFCKSNEAWADFSQNSIRYSTIIERICPGIFGNESDIYGLPEELVEAIQTECFFPEGLLCDLRRYQEWGVKYILHQEKVLLGDEMGLGKTIQAIATMVSLRNTGATHFIVICPASVITNWCREIKKHSTLSVIKVHGPSRNNSFEAWKKSGGVAVTTYETTGTLYLSEEFRFSMLVVDEAHYIKNPDAARSKNVRYIARRAERLLFMTGTALENKVDEMISLIDVLRPDIARSVEHIAFMSSAPEFREQVAPVYFRRKREDVLTELPELIENMEWCSMSGEEERKYIETLMTKNFMAIRRVSWNVDNLAQSSKAIRLKEIVDEAKEDGRKVIVFSFFLDTIAAVCTLLGGSCVNPINGSLSPQRRQEIIDEFDKAQPGKVLPAQIQSGGTGLNIQSASVVVICEPQFKPSIENQAISRAYRMGQSRNVLVYRLLCENSIDERLTEILEQKQREFDAFADKSVSGKESVEMDDKTFGNIIQEEINRINARKGNSIPTQAENKANNETIN